METRQTTIAGHLRAAFAPAPKLTDDEIETLQALLHRLAESGDTATLCQVILQCAGSIQRITG